MTIRELAFGTVSVTYGGHKYQIAYVRRNGPGSPVVFLHGLGGSLREAIHATWSDAIEHRTIIGVDFPGFGASSYADGLHLDLADVAEMLVPVLDELQLQRVTLIGHSMGGVVGLLLAARFPERVERFINVEGNLHDGDCFLSRLFASAPLGIRPHAAIFETLERLQQSETHERLQQSDGDDMAYFAYLARQNLGSVDAWHDYCRSLMRHSASGKLLQRFLSLRLPRLFIHGKKNATLPYLGVLRDAGIELAAIDRSGHFPAFSNPTQYYQTIAAFDQAPSP